MWDSCLVCETFPKCFASPKEKKCDQKFCCRDGVIPEPWTRYWDCWSLPEYSVQDSLWRISNWKVFVSFHISDLKDYSKELSSVFVYSHWNDYSSAVHLLSSPKLLSEMEHCRQSWEERRSVPSGGLVLRDGSWQMTLSLLLGGIGTNQDTVTDWKVGTLPRSRFLIWL